MVMATGPSHERREREEKAKSAPRPELLFIVSRDAIDHYEYLKRMFADDERVTVVLDRRRSGERRKGSKAQDPERRQADRRTKLLIDGRLERQGCAMVRLELPPRE